MGGMKLLLLLALAVNSAPQSGVKFTDVTAAAGLKFIHHTGAAGKKYLPETMGSGAAFADLDGDGWPEILLLNTKDWTPKGKKYFSALYKNNRNGTFTDVTAGSGLDVEMYAMGVAVADYDNDGRPDVYITALEGDRLFHNEGNNKFRDVTAASGIHNANFGTSAAWVDYDRDGKADLFVANYIQWTPKTDLWCSMDGATKSYCTPESSKGAPSKLFHNLGNGRFEDVSQKAGIADTTSKSLGVSVVGLRCLDVGASTGGFTDCLLQRGAKLVVAVDVGYGQLAQTLRTDPRVVVMERTNARALDAASIGGVVDLTVVDASFIGLGKLMPAIAACTRVGGELVALVKPQFEVGREEAARGRGVVRDQGVRARAIDAAASSVALSGFELLGRCDSTVPGPKGNVEAFVWARRVATGGVHSDA